MIYDELYDLKQYITSECKVNCIIGNPDVDDTQYPLVKITFEEEGLLHYQTSKQTVFDMPVSLKVIVTKGEELKAFKTIDKLLFKINQFNKQKGHMLEGAINPEYDDDKKTYEVTLQYNLKLLFQDTEA
jgi:hypothetical protein